MVFKNVPKLHGLVGCGVLFAAAAVPIGCGDDQFSGCEASRTCPPATGGGGGEAGEGTDTGGSSGRSGSGSGGSNAGATGSATGGRAGSDAGAGGSPDGEGGEGGSEPPPDMTPPTIVSVSPEDGDTGVHADANLVITFSEPMDRVSTQAAYQSTDIPSGSVAFSWNAESTVLTLEPSGGLEYAAGTSLDTPARAFALRVTDTAEDLAGNRMAADFDWAFQTLRRITQTIPVPFANVYRVATEGPVVACASGATSAFVPVGHIYLTNYGYQDTQGLVSIPIGALPSGIVQWEAATLTATSQYAPPVAALVERVRFTPPTSANFQTAALNPAVTFASNATAHSADLLSALMNDYGQSDSSQYRIRRSVYDTGDNESYTNFLCGQFALTARYLLQ